MARGKIPGPGGQDNRSVQLGNRQARAPIDNFRKRLGSREVHSSGSRREKAALVRGSENAVKREENLQLFTSTPFLLFILILLLGITSYIFWSLAQTPIRQMNQPTKV